MIISSPPRRKSEVLIGSGCVKQPPIDYIVIVAVAAAAAAAAAAEHNEVFLSMGLREATAHRRTSRPSRKSKVLIGFGLREATIYRRHRCRRTRWSSLFRVQPFIYRHRFSRMVDGGKVL
mmetsp:Transcript_14510/g.29765  ORF Transcript_14510/g.29765 Transcript_14510/m.29765 type:complete len:120 (+) Transcript_14510:92-451(+)